MGEFCHGKQVRPVILSVVHIKSKVLLEALISAFRLSVCLRVECGRHILRNPERLAKIPCELPCETRVSITDDFSGESKTFEDMREV